MFTAIFSLNSSVSSSAYCRNLLATSIKASLGQGWNQSMDVELIIPGNFLALILIRSPTGEKHKTILSDFLILS